MMRITIDTLGSANLGRWFRREIRLPYEFQITWGDLLVRRHGLVAPRAAPVELQKGLLPGSGLK